MSNASAHRRPTNPSQARRLVLVSTVSALALVASTAQSRTLPTDGVEVDLADAGHSVARSLLPIGGAEIDLTAAVAIRSDADQQTAQTDRPQALLDRVNNAKPGETAMENGWSADGGGGDKMTTRGPLRLAALHDHASVLTDLDGDLATLLDRAKTLAREIDAITSRTVVPTVRELDAAAIWKLAGATSEAPAEAKLWMAALAEDGAPADADLTAVDLTVHAADGVSPALALGMAAAIVEAQPDELATVSGEMLQVERAPGAIVTPGTQPQASAARVAAARVPQGEVASGRAVALITADAVASPRTVAATPADAPSRKTATGVIAETVVIADKAADKTDAKVDVTADNLASKDGAESRDHVKNLPWLKKRTAKGSPAGLDQAKQAPAAAIAEAAAAAPVATTLAVETETVAQAGDGEPQDEALAELTVAAVSDGELAEMRAGFMVNGFEIKFGIQAATYVNNNLVASYQFTSDDLENSIPATSTGSGITFQGAAPQQIVQVGAGNDASGALNFAGPITVVQNTLNGALIQHVATITIDVNGLTGGVTTAPSLAGGLSPYNLTLGFSN